MVKKNLLKATRPLKQKNLNLLNIYLFAKNKF